jgi:hypothetical protein
MAVPTAISLTFQFSALLNGRHYTNYGEIFQRTVAAHGTTADGCTLAHLATFARLPSRGRKGGKARLETMTEDQRKESARKAARARWSKQKGTFSRDTET